MPVLLDLNDLAKRYGGNPKSLVFARYAQALQKNSELEKAIEICQKGLADFPDYLSGYLVLASCLFEKKDFDSCLQNLQLALALDPKCLKALKMTGDVLVEQNKPGPAAEKYAATIELDPWDSKVADLYNRYAGGGDLGEVIEEEIPEGELTRKIPGSASEMEEDPFAGEMETELAGETGLSGFDEGGDDNEPPIFLDESEPEVSNEDSPTRADVMAELGLSEETSPVTESVEDNLFEEGDADEVENITLPEADIESAIDNLAGLDDAPELSDGAEEPFASETLGEAEAAAEEPQLESFPSKAEEPDLPVEPGVEIEESALPQEEESASELPGEEDIESAIDNLAGLEDSPELSDGAEESFVAETLGETEAEEPQLESIASETSELPGEADIENAIDNLAGLEDSPELSDGAEEPFATEALGETEAEESQLESFPPEAEEPDLPVEPGVEIEESALPQEEDIENAFDQILENETSPEAILVPETLPEEEEKTSEVDEADIEDAFDKLFDENEDENSAEAIGFDALNAFSEDSFDGGDTQVISEEDLRAAGILKSESELAESAALEQNNQDKEIKTAVRDLESESELEFNPEFNEQAATSSVKTITLAEIYFNQGLKEQALEIYRQLLEREPGNLQIQQRIEAIKASQVAEPGPASPTRDLDRRRRPRPGVKIKRRRR